MGIISVDSQYQYVIIFFLCISNAACPALVTFPSDYEAGRSVQSTSGL